MTDQLTDTLHSVWQASMTQPISEWVAEEAQTADPVQRRFRKRIRALRLKRRLTFERFHMEWDRYCQERQASLN